MRLSVILLGTFALCGAHLSWASPTGSIIGFVKDPSGAFIVGARITLTNAATSARLTALTGTSGAYLFPQLPPATYSLAAEAAGFKRAGITNVLVEVDQITRADLALEVGGVTETIEVSAAAPLLQSDRSTLSNVVDSRTISSMPLNTRQFLDLALLTPGVVPAAVGALGGFAVAGARSESNVAQIDGVANMDAPDNIVLTNFRITDAVQEFAVQTSVALPEFGRGTGGQVNIVTRSGGNRFHGSAFEYFRNTQMDAADFFINKSAGSKSPLNRNQFGSTLGGPIVRDRTFFFLSYEGFRQVAPQVSSTRVPTAADRAMVSDPISRRLLQFWPEPNASGTTNYIGNAPARNSDDTGLARIDHAISSADRLSGRCIEFQGSGVTAGPTPLTGGDSSAPVTRSLVLSETHTFTPRFSNEIRLGFSRNTIYMAVQDLGFNAATIFTDPAGNPLPGVIDGSKDLAHSGLPRITVAGGFAALGGSNMRPFARTANSYELYDNMSLISPFGQSRHSWRWGFHARREDLRHRNESSSRGLFSFNSFPDFAKGLVNTASLLTGSSLNYSRRYPWDLFWQDQYKVKDNFTLNYGVRYEYFSVSEESRNNWANFIPGVGPMVAGSNRILDSDPAKTGPASIFFRQAPFTLSSSAGVKPDRNNFGPVLGFAYSPRFARSVFGENATVIRGGFRVGYDDDFTLLLTNLARNTPITLATRQVAGTTQPVTFPWAIGFNQDVPLISNFGKQGPGSATLGVLPFYAVDPNLRSAYLYQFNFGIQRKLRQSFSIEADYQGSAGHKLDLLVDQNEPRVIVMDATKRGLLAPNEQIFPYNHFAGVSTGKSIGNSNYNGLIATAKYQGRQGIFLQGSYTLGKSIDDRSATQTTGQGEPNLPADSYNLRLERGPSGFDIRHRAVFVYVIELPVGPGHRVLGWNNGWNRQILGGWQISGNTTSQTGAPFTVTTGAPDYSGFNSGGGAVNAGGNSDRPDVTRQGPLPQNNRNPDAAFDVNYFSRALLAGRVGTSGRNQYYGPGVQNYDFAAAKNFPLWAKLGEQVRLQFRADFFNLFNHTNFANPVRMMSDANFGKIIQTAATAIQAGTLSTTAGPMGGPRLIQLSLRLQF
ncbi:MAG: TonB-dependent receptor [Acidobacteriia bacterium]|nr:TonB-dependent receptor [Terriglobia bacterium]